MHMQKAKVLGNGDINVQLKESGTAKSRFHY